MRSLVIVALFAVAASATAADPGTGPNPYADCGIGAAIFPTSDIGAAISNVIWDVGTTAVVSATASPETCQGSSAATAKLIFDAFPEIADETARGTGQHLAAILEIQQCTATDHPTIADGIREGFKDQLSEDGYQDKTRLEKSQAYYSLVTEQTTIAGCGVS